MMQAVAQYFARLADGFGRGWTTFWFTPSGPDVLCAIRLLMGLLVVYLHATLSLDLVTFFAAGGMLPSTEIAPLEGGAFSYLNYFSQPAELWIVHLLGLAVLILFALGFWTRPMSIAALIVFLSDVNRAPMITGRTESVAAMVLCYLCLAPCGRRLSIDALLARRAAATFPQTATVEASSTSATIATRLIQIHLALLVAMMGLSQLSGEIWWTGAGVWWLVARPESRLVDLTGLHTTPQVLQFWTHVIVFFELCFPMLIWVPLARPLLLAVGAVVWGSIALLTGDVTFSLAMMIASMAFISPAWLQECCAPASNASAATP
jgi:hypothetical protein